MSKSVLAGADFESRVSSVLNRDVRSFGKKHLFDGREDTCWNSEQGRPQWVHLQFPAGQAAGGVTVGAVALMFQGGFVGKDCRLEALVGGAGDAPARFETRLRFYPEDNNRLQVFPLPEPAAATAFRVVFPDSTDMFGRVTVYQLDLLGGS